MTFAHPQLPKDICALLGIAGLEDAVFEVLDQSEPLEFTDSLQVSKAHAHLKLRDRSNSSNRACVTGSGCILYHCYRLVAPLCLPGLFDTL